MRWHSIFVLVEYIQDHVNNNNPILEIVRTYSSSQIWTSNSLLIRVCININLRISFNSRGPSFVRNYQSCTQWIFLEPLFDRVCLNVSYHRSCIWKSLSKYKILPNGSSSLTKICKVWYRGALVLTRKDVGPGGLWILPIDGRASLAQDEIKQEQNPSSIAAATVYTLSYKQQK